VNAFTVRSTGWWLSTIASTIRGARNPSGISGRTDRPSIPSRLASSPTDRTLPDTRSSAHLRARDRFEQRALMSAHTDDGTQRLGQRSWTGSICPSTSSREISVRDYVPDSSATGSFSDRRILVLIIVGFVARQSRAQSTAHGIVGTWIVNVTPLFGAERAGHLNADYRQPRGG